MDTLLELLRTHVAVPAGAILACLLVGRILSALFVRALKRWLSRPGFDSERLTVLRTPTYCMLAAILLRWLLPALSISPVVSEPLAHAAVVFAIVFAGWTTLRATRVLEAVLVAGLDLDAKDNLHARALHTQFAAFQNIAAFLIVLSVLAFVLLTFDAVRQLGAGLLASAGVAGIVVGFAAQRSIATLLAGIQIAFTQPFRVGDAVLVEGEFGHIEEITLTYVVVRVWDLRRLVIPINYFIEKPFQNWTRTSASLLAPVEIHVDYRTPVDAVRGELQRLLDQAQEWDGEVNNVQVTAAADKTVILRALCSAANAGAAWNLRCKVREGLIAFLNQHHPSCLPRARAEVDSRPGAPAHSAAALR